MTSIIHAIEAIDEVKQEILLIDPSPSERLLLDRAYRALKQASELLIELDKLEVEVKS